ncbi:MAG TPA: hypothetical protein VGK54_08230 [Chloroflexota bacterium]
MEQGPKVYRPCTTGLKCPGFYRSDYLKRIKNGLESQGTGNIVEDLEAKLRALGSGSRVEGRDCTDACPIPGERANVEGPDGRLAKLFWDDLDGFLQKWEQAGHAAVGGG